MALSEEVFKKILSRERQARKEAEKIIEGRSLELYLANQELIKLNHALKVAKEKAEEATKAKSLFLSNMSHEIRTPLNAILGMTDLIVEDSTDQLALTHANSIKYSADILLKIVNEILDFSKIEAGKLTFEKTTFCLKQLIENLEVIFKKTATDKQLFFEIDIAPETPANLLGDQLKLNQILINLLSNAFKFTKRGGIKLSVESRKNQDNQSLFLFKITDTGIGIPKNKQAEIFESFTQANNSTTRKYGGTGLGLAITKKLIELQGGAITIESELDIGTSFLVELPIELSAISSKKSPHPQDYEILKSIRVLLVEDNPVNRIFMRQVFKRKSIPAEFAVNGKEAIDKLSSEKFDFVFMDLHMPVMDGREAIRIIRDQNSSVLDHHLPVFALSADVFEETKIEVQELGMNGYITKPVDIEIIYNTLRDLFANS